MIRIVDHEVPFEERTFFARAVAALKQENPDQVQIVHSTEYDLFLPLPPQFDRAVMDRFACYVPGWEMPKNSTEYLTHNYGLITDFLAEAFHYQLKHSNRYEEVSQRIRLGSSVEGRDEKGIKKTVGAFLKILHPTDGPGDREFEEYVEYAVECRRRVKKQMNKRKPDDEFARVNLSYIKADGQEQIVFCPESKRASATREPLRRRLRKAEEETRPAQETKPEPEPKEPEKASSDQATQAKSTAPEVEEKHFTIRR